MQSSDNTSRCSNHINWLRLAVDCGVVSLAVQSRTKECSEWKGRKETGINNGNQFTLKDRTAKAHRKRLSRTQLTPHSDPVTTGARHNRVSGESCPRKRTKPGLQSLSGRHRFGYRPAVKHRPLKIKFISCPVALNHNKRSSRESCQKAPRTSKQCVSSVWQRGNTPPESVKH